MTHKICCISAGICISFLAAIIQLDTAAKILTVSSSELYAYYWFDWRFSIIQTLNNIIQFVPIVVTILGMFNPVISNKNDILLSIIKNVLIFCCFAVLTTLIIFVLVDKTQETITFNVFHSSLLALNNMVLYCFYWYSIGYLIGIISKRKFVNLVLLFILFFSETYLFSFFISELDCLLLFLPITNSKSVAIANFSYISEHLIKNNIDVFYYSYSDPLVLEKLFGGKSFLYSLSISLGYLLILVATRKEIISE